MYMEIYKIIKNPSPPPRFFLTKLKWVTEWDWNFVIDLESWSQDELHSLFNGNLASRGGQLPLNPAYGILEIGSNYIMFIFSAL